MIALTALVLTLALRKSLRQALDAPRGQGGNAYARELANNGPYQFIAAFRNNELDYSQFYGSLNEEDSTKLIQRAIAYYQVASYGFSHHLLDWQPEPIERTALKD